MIAAGMVNPRWDPAATRATRASAGPEWLADRTALDPETGCWLWQMSTRNGYGQGRYKGQLDYAHRIAWRLAFGVIPDKLVVDHLCFTPRCANPRHLQLLSQGDNARRREIAVLGIWECGHEREGNTYTWRDQGSCLRCRRARSLDHSRRKKEVA